MDPAHRRSLEGFTATVSAIPDMPQAVPAMGQTRDFKAHCKRAGRRPIRARRIDIREAFNDGSFVPAKKRGLAVGKTKRGKGTKIMATVDVSGFPVAAHIESASPHEVKLVEVPIDCGFTPYAPDKIIGAKAYDSDRLDKSLELERGIELIATHKRNRKEPRTQDGRKPRR